MSLSTAMFRLLPVDAMDAVNFPQAQTLSDEAARARLALELEQVWTTEELAAALKKANRPRRQPRRQPVVPKNRKGFAAKPLHRSANGRQRRTQPSGSRGGEGGQAAQLRAGVEGEAQGGPQKRRAACDRKSQRAAGKARKRAAQEVRAASGARVDCQAIRKIGLTLGACPRWVGPINGCVTLHGHNMFFLFFFFSFFLLSFVFPFSFTHLFFSLFLCFSLFLSLSLSLFSFFSLFFLFWVRETAGVSEACVGAGAHLRTTHPVLAFYSNIFAEGIDMSGAGRFMLPEVGPAKCVCVCVQLYRLALPLLFLTERSVCVHRGQQFSSQFFGPVGEFPWCVHCSGLVLSHPVCVLLSICSFADGRAILEQARGCLLSLFCVCFSMSLKLTHFLAVIMRRWLRRHVGVPGFVMGYLCPFCTSCWVLSLLVVPPSLGVIEYFVMGLCQSCKDSVFSMVLHFPCKWCCCRHSLFSTLNAMWCISGAFQAADGYLIVLAREFHLPFKCRKWLDVVKQPELVRFARVLVPFSARLFRCWPSTPTSPTRAQASLSHASRVLSIMCAVWLL